MKKLMVGVGLGLAAVSQAHAYNGIEIVQVDGVNNSNSLSVVQNHSARPTNCHSQPAHSQSVHCSSASQMVQAQRAMPQQRVQIQQGNNSQRVVVQQQSQQRAAQQQRQMQQKRANQERAAQQQRVAQQQRATQQQRAATPASQRQIQQQHVNQQRIAQQRVAQQQRQMQQQRANQQRVAAPHAQKASANRNHQQVLQAQRAKRQAMFAAQAKRKALLLAQQRKRAAMLEQQKRRKVQLAQQQQRAAHQAAMQAAKKKRAALLVQQKRRALQLAQQKRQQAQKRAALLAQQKRRVALQQQSQRSACSCPPVRSQPARVVQKRPKPVVQQARRVVQPRRVVPQVRRVVQQPVVQPRVQYSQQVITTREVVKNFVPKQEVISRRIITTRPSSAQLANTPAPVVVRPAPRISASQNIMQQSVERHDAQHSRAVWSGARNVNVQHPRHLVRPVVPSQRSVVQHEARLRQQRLQQIRMAQIAAQKRRQHRRHVQSAPVVRMEPMATYVKPMTKSAVARPVASHSGGWQRRAAVNSHHSGNAYAMYQG